MPVDRHDKYQSGGISKAMYDNHGNHHVNSQQRQETLKQEKMPVDFTIDMLNITITWNITSNV